MVRKVETSTNQAAELVAKFLTLSEGEHASHRKFLLSDILKSTAHRHPDLKQLLENVSIPASLDPIRGDERMLRRLFYNLLQNADEATSEPKRIGIEAENVTLEPDNPYALDAGDYVKVSVTDNGRGIPPEHLDRIFDPYFSTKQTPNKKGLGLGLAICYAVVKKHNGHIEVRSQEGEGTTVDCYLPAFI